MSLSSRIAKLTFYILKLSENIASTVNVIIFSPRPYLVIIVRFSGISEHVLALEAIDTRDPLLVSLLKTKVVAAPDGEPNVVVRSVVL